MILRTDEALFAVPTAKPGRLKILLPVGNQLTAEAEPPIAAPKIQSETHPDEHLWRQFIGPYADRYLTHFTKFGLGQTPKFALTWNWPALLYISFLVSLSKNVHVCVGLRRRPDDLDLLNRRHDRGPHRSIMAGATANYVYYWHCREHIREIKKSTGPDPEKLDEALRNPVVSSRT